MEDKQIIDKEPVPGTSTSDASQTDGQKQQSNIDENQNKGNDNDVTMKESTSDTRTSDDSQSSESESVRHNQEMENADGQKQQSKSGNKFFVHLTGKTLNAEKKVIDHLKKQISCLEKVKTVDECDFILIFCPVVSRAGTDIEAALKTLKEISGTEKGIKPAFLVVLHHTFDKECIIPDSRRAVSRQNLVTVDCLFHEDQGLLECHKNQQSLDTIIDLVKPQVSNIRLPSKEEIFTQLETCKKQVKEKLQSFTDTKILPKLELYFSWKKSSKGSNEETNKDKQNPEQSKPTKTNENNAVWTNDRQLLLVSSSEGGASSSSDSSQLRLVLLGRTGSGKTAARNTILGRVEKTQASLSQATSISTQQSERTQGEVSRRKVTVVDTPDWFSPGLSLEKLRQDVSSCVQLSDPGPHAFLLVIPLKQPTGEERGMLEKMEEIFGERCWRNTMIIFSVTGELQKNIEVFIKSDQEIQRLVEKCENRNHCLNINESGDGSQVSELLEKIEEMMAQNDWRFYSSKIYLKTLDYIGETEKMIREKIETLKNYEWIEECNDEKKGKHENEQAEATEPSDKRLKGNSGMVFQEVHAEAERNEKNEMKNTLCEIWRSVLTSSMKMQEDFSMEK